MGMMKASLGKLEQKAQMHTYVLRLPDGEEVRYTSEDELEAFSAVMAKEEHWLVPYFLQADTSEGFPGLVRALSRARVEQGGGQ